jgi:hypothetical protein
MKENQLAVGLIREQWYLVHQRSEYTNIWVSFRVCIVFLKKKIRATIFAVT